MTESRDKLAFVSHTHIISAVWTVLDMPEKARALKPKSFEVRLTVVCQLVG